MKKLLFISLLLLSIMSFGQDFKLNYSKNNSVFTPPYSFKGSEYVIKIDTIKVKALCSYDYSYSDNFSELKIEPVFVTYLLQIRKHYRPHYSIITEPSITPIGYLYEDGKELSKIINVWICKEL